MNYKFITEADTTKAEETSHRMSKQGWKLISVNVLNNPTPKMFDSLITIYLTFEKP